MAQDIFISHSRRDKSIPGRNGVRVEFVSGVDGGIEEFVLHLQPGDLVGRRIR